MIERRSTATGERRTPPVPELAHPYMRTSLLRAVNLRLTHTDLPTLIGHGCPAIRLAGHIRNLFSGKPRPIHRGLARGVVSPAETTIPLKLRSVRDFQGGAVATGSQSNVKFE